MSIRDRYRNDPVFRRVVDMIQACIEEATFTPTEMREAAMLAQIMYEERHPRPIAFTKEQIMRGL